MNSRQKVFYQCEPKVLELELQFTWSTNDCPIVALIQFSSDRPFRGLSLSVAAPPDVCIDFNCGLNDVYLPRIRRAMFALSPVAGATNSVRSNDRCSPVNNAGSVVVSQVSEHARQVWCIVWTHSNTPVVQLKKQKIIIVVILFLFYHLQQLPLKAFRFHCAMIVPPPDTNSNFHSTLHTHTHITWKRL